MDWETEAQRGQALASPWAPPNSLGCNLGLLESRRTLGDRGLGKARAVLGKAGQGASRLTYPQAVSWILTPQVSHHLPDYI